MKPKSPLVDKKVQAQLRACTQTAAAVLWESLACGRPADRTLAGLMRGHREYGSRDRRLISNTVFALFRWWGWLRPLAPYAFLEALQAENRQELAAPERPMREWAPIILAAWLLDDSEIPEAATTLARQAGADTRHLESWVQPAVLQKRGAAVLRLLKALNQDSVLCLEALAPDWTAEELQDPTLMEKLVGWLQRRPPLWLRAQTADAEALVRELSEAGLAPRPHPQMPGALRLDDPRVNLYTLLAYRKGRVEVQDLASQVIGAVCSPKPKERWWDACAGGGGKSLQLAALMQGSGSVTASDIRAYKLEDLKMRARRGGFSNIRCKPWDGKRLRAKQAKYDGVLVDAPCTCSGTWRRNPDARWTSLREEIVEMGDLQFGILSHAASGVKPGGVLVYGTCSLFRRENDEVVGRFLHENPEFKLDPFTNPLTGQPCNGTLQIWPWDGNCDAMFAARFRRQD